MGQGGDDAAAHRQGRSVGREDAGRSHADAHGGTLWPHQRGTGPSQRRRQYHRQNKGEELRFQIRS